MISGKRHDVPPRSLSARGHLATDGTRSPRSPSGARWRETAEFSSRLTRYGAEARQTSIAWPVGCRSWFAMSQFLPRYHPKMLLTTDDLRCGPLKRRAAVEQGHHFPLEVEGIGERRGGSRVFAPGKIEARLVGGHLHTLPVERQEEPWGFGDCPDSEPLDARQDVCATAQQLAVVARLAPAEVQGPPAAARWAGKDVAVLQ